MSREEKEGGFISHLAELRKRLIHSFIFLVIFFVVCYFFAEHLYGFLVEPFARAVRDCLLYTSPSPRDKHRSRMPSSA